MGFFSKVKKKIKKAIPREIAPFLPALASIYGGPALASMFGSMNPILAQGLGAALADAGTQELTSDRTRLESSLFSGIMGGIRGSSMTETGQFGEQFGNASKLKADAALAKATNPTQYATDLAAGKYGTGFQRSVGGLQDFANAKNPFSIAGASNIAVTASPKIGYNEVERLNRDLAARAAELARQQGLDYEEAMKYAEQYFYGSNPDASEEDFADFMKHYNSDLTNPNMANGGRIGFEEGGFSSGGDYSTATREQLPIQQAASRIPRPGPSMPIGIGGIIGGIIGGPGIIRPNPQPSLPPRPPEEAIKDKLNNFYETGNPNPIRFPGFPGMQGLTVKQRLENFNAKQAGSPQPHRNPFIFNRYPGMPFEGMYNRGLDMPARQTFADGSQDYAGDVYGDRDRDSLNMEAFYDEYPETQVGSYINENRYKSEKIEKLEAKLNEIIDMRQRTADRSRNPENDGEPSLMEKLLDKEINALYADRTNDDIRKSETQKRDEMNARFAEENAKKQQMIQDYYNNLGVYARPGRAMGGMMNAGMMNRPNFNYGGGVQPQQQPSSTNLAGMGPLAGLGGVLGGFGFGGLQPAVPPPVNMQPNQSGMVGNIMNAVKTGLDGATQDIQSNVSSQFKPQEVLVPTNNNGGGNFQPSVTGGTLQELLGTNMGMGGGRGPFSQLQSMSNGGRIGYANGGMPDRPNFNYGSGRQTPQGDPIAPNVPPGMQMDLRQGGFIELGTEPRADDVPAMVGKDEFVLNDRAVAGIGKMLTGKPDPRAGARALYEIQEKMEANV
tara:strand:- start:2052 stop:4400 length:2349 start_codon:yes stop_codon:yes gene_type:complete